MGRDNPINVTRASLPPIEEYEELLREIWRTAWLTNMGKYHEELKVRLGTYLGVEGIELFVNGHSALELCIQAMGLEGEVVTTPFSFASTTHAIVRSGLTPVFCDIEPDSCTLDPQKLEACITERTCAILPVHVYGNICDVEAIGRIAKKHGLKVIYDAAHAFGERFHGKGVGAFGDASMFSFHATKVFNTIEGGAVTTGAPSPELMHRLYEMKNFGILGQEEVASVGANGKMNEFAAAMGICNLRHVQEYIDARRRVSERYRENLEGVPGLILNPEQPGLVRNYAYFPVRFHGFRSSRDQVYGRLLEEGICARKYFYPCINDYACYRDRYSSDSTPVAKQAAQEVLTLPIYPELPLETVDEICRIVLER